MTQVFNPHGSYRVGYAINCLYGSANSLDAGNPAATRVNEVTVQHFDIYSPENQVRGSMVGHATISIYLLMTTGQFCNWSLVVTQGSEWSPPPPIPAGQTPPR